MSIFEQYTGRGMYYTADELDRLRNPVKYGYTQASYNAFGEQAQRRAENRARADQASMDVIPYSQIGPGFSFGGYGGHTSEATAGLAGFGGDYNVYTSENYGSGDAGDRGGLPSYGVRPSYGQINQGIASLPFDDRDDSSQGNIAFYSDIMEGLKNMAYGPFSALTKVAYGVATNAPNTPYLVVDQETGKLSWSDGQSIADSLAMPAHEIDAITGNIRNSDATTFAAPASYAQFASPGQPIPEEVDPFAFEDNRARGNLSLPALGSDGLPVSAAGLAIDPYETGEYFLGSNISTSQLREGLAREAVQEVFDVTNPPAPTRTVSFSSVPTSMRSRPAPAPAPAPAPRPAPKPVAVVDRSVVTAVDPYSFEDTRADSRDLGGSLRGYDDFTAADFGGFSDPDPGDASGGFEM